MLGTPDYALSTRKTCLPSYVVGSTINLTNEKDEYTSILQTQPNLVTDLTNEEKRDVAPNHLNFI